jgi:hypothetical protein
LISGGGPGVVAHPSHAGALLWGGAARATWLWPWRAAESWETSWPKEGRMAEPKTRMTRASVAAFLDAITDGVKRKDCLAVLDIMKKATRAQPRMWGTSIVGFGAYAQKYADGKVVEWPVVGFSPRKQNLTLYLMPGFEGFDELLKKLGKHKTGKVCVYLQTLKDIDVKVLKQLVAGSVRHIKDTHPTRF